MPSNHASFSQSRKFYLQSTKILYPSLNKICPYINTCTAAWGRTSLRLPDRINYNISRNLSATIKNLPKFSQNGITKKRSIQPNLRNVLQQLDYIFSKTNSAPTTTITNNFLSMSREEVHSIF